MNNNELNKSRNVLIHYASGYIAACTSVTLLFPLNKLIFRQILDGFSFKDAFKQIKDEGVLLAYRGLLPPLIQKSLCFSIMFGSQNEYSLWLNQLVNKTNKKFVNNMNKNTKNFCITVVSGCLAGMTEAILAPFERIQAVLQMQQYHNRYKHTWHVSYDIYKNYGFKEFYRGFVPICLRNTFSSAVFFASKEQIKIHFPHKKGRLKTTLYDFINGSLLGAIISTLFYPFNVLKSHMQAQIGGNYLTMSETFRFVYESRNRKINLFYKGVGSNFLRAVFAWGITNSAYEFSLNQLESF